MKKTDVIHAIQRKENNMDCYGTNRVDYCEEEGCLWKSEVDHHSKGSLWTGVAHEGNHSHR